MAENAGARDRMGGVGQGYRVGEGVGDCVGRETICVLLSSSVLLS